ncbi:G/U mismatch-specific DNA glycosylase [Sediminibacillus massiliensis]|uniref:G/U mismatch-specific DNA glycosylase n=1 Tax=Sediminibacillus massiliensis TaxID=1926277 RepID=UPI0009882EF2|nr:G/U mismatch-specific DNA glycosylase [Sediminibacillus massiliensis]
MLEPIPDHLEKGLKILFIGFNPSVKSSETGHHYANPNNRFWKILHQSGLTPRKYSPEEDSKLLEMGYGFTNIVARPTKEAAEITKEEYEHGRRLLIERISHYQPQAACFVGKGVYQEYSKKRQVPWGLQESSIVPGVKEFVAPSSSGLVRMRIEEIVSIYKQLYLLLQE